MTFYVAFNSFVAQLASEIYLKALFKFDAHNFLQSIWNPMRDLFQLRRCLSYFNVIKVFLAIVTPDEHSTKDIPSILNNSWNLVRVRLNIIKMIKKISIGREEFAEQNFISKMNWSVLTKNFLPSSLITFIEI